MKFQISAVAIALSTSLSVSAEQQAEQLSNIEQVTVLGRASDHKASLGGINLKELPFNAHVVHFEELERLKFVDPNEFLDRIPGETQVRNLRIPVGSKSYTIPMLDGMPLESPYEGATQRLDRVNTSDIERIEIIKGPASALYGNNAFGGVVNVISRTPVENTAKLFLEAGNLNRSRMGAYLSGSQNKLGYSFDASSRRMDGKRELELNDRDQLSSKLTYQLNPETQLSGRFEHLKENTNTRADLTAEELKADPTQAGKLSSEEDIEQQTLSLRALHQLKQGELDVQFARREKDSIGSSRFRGPQDENDLAYSGRIVYTYKLADDTLAVGTDLYFGEQNTRRYGRTDFDLQGDFTRFKNELNIQAYFAQYHYQINDCLSLTGGARYENIELRSSDFNQSASFSRTSPKLGANYQINDSHQLWMGVSEGFYAPHLSHMFDPEHGNPDLTPEIARNIELGYRGHLPNWSWDISVYQNKVSDYLVTQELVDNRGNEYEFTQNAGKVSLTGIESVVEFTPDSGNWRLGLTHTYNDNTYDRFVQSTPGASDDLSGKELRRSPKHHGNLRFAWLSIDDLIVELEADFYSPYFADDANSEASRFKRDERLNLRISYEFQNWRIWLHGLNLTDTLEDRATYSRGKMKFRTSPGRTFYAGVSYQF